jgi:hypothetical protein
MGQFVQTNGDYNIKTSEGGIIKLDTGPGVGTVRVTGNLLVEGDTLTVSAENLNVNDNVITLNYGETGAGVTLRYSGIQIERGSETSAALIFDENDNTWIFGLGTPETGFNYSDSKIRLKEIKTNADTDSGDLTLIGSGTGVVKVAGTLNYEVQVTDDDDIPNKKYVDDAIQNNPTFQVLTNDSRVIVTDKDTVGSLAYLTAQTGYSTFGESGISVIVDGQLNSQFFRNRTVIQDLEFLDNEITNNSTNTDISFRTQGTGKVKTNYAFQFEKIALTPASVSDSVIVYGADPGIGTTGLWFVNSARSGELINKNKALVFSMIF